MFYFTTNQPERYQQMTFEQMLMGIVPTSPAIKFNRNSSITRVVMPHTELYQRLQEKTDVDTMILALKTFNAMYYEKYLNQIRNYEAIPPAKRIFNNKLQRDYENLEAIPTQEEREAIITAWTEENNRLSGQCYRTFKMRKKSNRRKFRTINAPSDDLSDALRTLKTTLENMMVKSYHASAFAYVEGRSTIDAVQKHRDWESNWYSHFDFSDFFGSTTHDFLMKQLGMIYPFHFIMMNPDGETELSKCLQLCFLDGGLPQGTPISPFLTNVMMIPFDHILSNTLNNFEFANGKKERFVYTRYADDLIISSRGTFDVKAIEKFIIDVLNEMRAPFSLNTEKTHYGSRAGSNWNLGVMVNKDNKITVGWEKKQHLKADLNNYTLDRQSDTPWDLDEIYALQGRISYYKSIEPEYIDFVINRHNKKHRVDVLNDIKTDIKNYKAY